MGMDQEQLGDEARDAFSDTTFPTTKEPLLATAEAAGGTELVDAVRRLPLAEFADLDQLVRSIVDPGVAPQGDIPVRDQPGS
jgi:hypothetical protein